jgi:hypothetical protein
MPWGKYAGELLEDIPAGYLAWIYEASSAPPDLRDAVREELGRRLSISRRPCRCAAPAQLAANVEAWFRSLAKRFHPDRGGSDRDMVVCNEAHEMLKEALQL